ncbi:unnamed protein product [Phytophthora fragariaefolia]|uniref:Unnamed protein product n=1 Tax=Phytophthora fragariaefolia TaxID=1490495 RepID=A0A9W6XUG6_9STRA|nr:unnamed protein product [Phytophthora fragariaefolia]
MDFSRGFPSATLLNQGNKASSDIGSTKTPLNQARSADRQSARRNSVDGREVDLDPDLDSGLADKPQPPPQRYGFTDLPIKPKSYPFSTRHGKIEAKMTTTRKKMKAPDAEVEDQDSSTTDQWSVQAIEAAFHK